MSAEEKRCSKCGTVRPIADFYADRRASDGKRSDCKRCVLAGNRAWEKANHDHVRRLEREWTRRNPDKVQAKRERYASRRRELNKRNEQLHQEGKRARSLLRSAIRSGRMKRGEHCQSCGGSGNIHGHHPDYAKPLEVIWLCVSCHYYANRGLTPPVVAAVREEYTTDKGEPR